MKRTISMKWVSSLLLLVVAQGSAFGQILINEDFQSRTAGAVSLASDIGASYIETPFLRVDDYDTYIGPSGNRLLYVSDTSTSTTGGKARWENSSESATKGSFSIDFNNFSAPNSGDFWMRAGNGATMAVELCADSTGTLYLYDGATLIATINSIDMTGIGGDQTISINFDASAGTFSGTLDGAVITAASGGATTFGFRTAASSLNSIEVQCTGNTAAKGNAMVDNISMTKAMLLLFDEGFENNAANAGILGALDGQHGWSADPGAVVQDSIAYAGTQALELQDALASQPFRDTAFLTDVLATVYIRPEASGAPTSIPANATAVFYVNSSLNLVVYSNTAPVELAVAVDTNAWTEFGVTCDYAAQTWSIDVDGAPAASGLPFYSAQARLSGLVLVDDDPAGTGSYIDEISVSAQGTMNDSDYDTLPDWWEMRYFAGLADADPASISSNGVNTVWEAYIAGFDPTDPLAWFGVSGFVVDTGLGHTLQWEQAPGRAYTVYWTSNLLDGFAVLQDDYVGGSYTDTVHSAESQGFYRLDVEIAP
ncbi:MAG: hypothetical protein ABFR33_11490 [Verrucomicrobiota bacterium]